jgi:hypothetical protein
MGHVAPEKIADYLGGRLSGRKRERLEAHLEACASCRTVQLRVQNAVETLRDLAGAQAPSSSSVGSARIEATLRWTTRQVPKYAPARPWRIALVGALAAAAAVVVVIKRPWRHAPSPAAKTELAQTAVQPREAPPIERLDAVVTLRSGDVRVGGAPLDARRHVGQGEALTTGAGARVAIQWGEGSGALLAPQSELHLARLESRAQELDLARGKVGVRVGPHQPGEALRVLTRDHEVTVHGTWFNVACDVHGTTIEVLEGVVEVSSREGDGSSTRVAAPERAFFPRGRGAPEGTRVLSGKEAGALRLAGEMGLLAWTSAVRIDETTGLLDVATTPPAQLAADGIPFGQTPLMLRRVRGRHLIELSRPGFATISRWVTVGAEPGELHLALLPRDASDLTTSARDEVQAVFHARKRVLEACYEHGLKRDPSLAGTVTLAVQVGPAGQVLATQLKNDTLSKSDPNVTQCMQHETAGWVFQKARDAVVEYPLTFRQPDMAPLP